MFNFEKYIKEDLLVSIYTNPDNTSKFICGYFIFANYTDVIIRSVTPYGEYDGLILEKIENIFNISTDGKYEQKIKKLMKKRYTQKDNFIPKIDNYVYDLLSYAKDKELVVTLQLFNSGYDDCSGYIKEITNDLVTVLSLDEYGDSDETSEIVLENITTLCVNTIDEQVLKILHEF